jgi:hypothetical protein
MKMACDTALKNRKYDADGRLHILRTPISKAAVNPYSAEEIPNAEKLGLRPGRVYHLLRDPGELAKAAPSFARIQLMFKHITVNSEDPKQDSIAGTVGSEVSFEAPYLVADLCVWDAEAIAGIETDTVKELSASYRYRADMTPGTFEGQRYDGVMRDIQGNHVALVKAGRAGPDVMAADEEMETKMAKAEEMADKVAGDKDDNAEKYADVAVKTGDKKAKDRKRIARDAQTAEERAMWAQMRKDGTADDPNDDSMPASLRKAKDKKHAKDWEFDDWAKDEEERELEKDDPQGQDRRKARDAEEDEEDREKRKEYAKKAEDAEKMCRDNFNDLVRKLQDKGYSQEYATKVAGKVAAEKGKTGGDKKAKDSEETKKAEDRMKQAMDEFRAELREAEDARRAVRPAVGDVIAQDSAEDIYKFALDEMGVDHKDVRGVASLRALFNLARSVSRTKPELAYDSKGIEDKFPSATRKINVM